MDKIILSTALQSLFGTTKTTCSYLPTVTSAGAPDGLISIANLSSVLGVVTVYVTDWDDAPSGIFYTTNTTAHRPVSATLTGLCYKNKSGHTIQFAFRAINGEIYYRTRSEPTGTFSAWYKINVTIQS